MGECEVRIGLGRCCSNTCMTQRQTLSIKLVVSLDVTWIIFLDFLDSTKNGKLYVGQMPVRRHLVIRITILQQRHVNVGNLSQTAQPDKIIVIHAIWLALINISD